MITPQSAYLDPSVMTYAIQAIAGVIVAVGAVVIVYWRKAKKKVTDKLGIEENKKKEVEEEIKIIDNPEETVEIKSETASEPTEADSKND